MNKEVKKPSPTMANSFSSASTLGKAATGPLSAGGSGARRMRNPRRVGSSAGQGSLEANNGQTRKGVIVPRAIDFSTLAMSSLRKYKRAHRIRTSPAMNKADLVDVINKHWATLPADEASIIDSFAMAVRNTHGTCKY